MVYNYFITILKVIFEMMKKLILNSLITIIALGGATVALAQDTGTLPPPQNASTSGVKPPRPVKAMMDDKREMELKNKMASTAEARKDKLASTTERLKEKREDIKDRIASGTEKMKERMEDRRERIMKEVKRQFDKMLRRIEATIQREESIMSKLNTRIEKVKTGGGNTTEAEKLTAEAKTHIESAKTDLANLKLTASTTAQNLSTTTDTVKKENLEKMKGIEKGIEKHLKEAHKMLEKALGSLKGMSQLNNGKATTTPTATTTGTN